MHYSMIAEIKQPLVIISFMLCLDISLAYKEVHFVKSDCSVYRHYLENENDEYRIVWNGEKYPRICSLRFYSYGGYKLQAEVTEFNLECGKPGINRYLKFYWGIEMDIERHSCHATLPISYSRDNVLFVELEPDEDIERSNSRIRIKISAKAVQKEDHSSGGYSVDNLGFIVIGIVVVVVFLTVCCVAYRRNQAARQACINNDSVLIQRHGDHVIVGTPNQNQSSQYGHHRTEEGHSPLIQYGYQPPVQPTAPSLPPPQPLNSSGFGSLQPNEGKAAPPPSYEDVISKGSNYDMRE